MEWRKRWGEGKGGFLSRKGRGKSSKHIYTNTCVQLCTSILNYVMHAIYNESTFRGGKRRCLEPAFPPLRPLHPRKTLPQLLKQLLCTNEQNYVQLFTEPSNLSVSTFRIDSACPHVLDAADLTMDLSNGSIQWIRTRSPETLPQL